MRAPEGWIQDPCGNWTIRFHLDQNSWSRNLFVFLDQGKAMGNGYPALLKSRKYVPRADAIAIWNKLISQGWKRIQPQWGLDAES